METIRMIIDGERLSSIVELPDEFRHRELEVIVLSHGDSPEGLPKKNNLTTVGSVKGILKRYANPSLIEREKGAWEKAAAEKELEKLNNDYS